MPFDGKNLTETQKNCLELADYIERQPDEMFDMQNWGNPACGTPGCIAGHALVFWRPEISTYHGAARKLGASSAEVPCHAVSPFFGEFGEVKTKSGGSIELGRVTKPMAVAALRRFVLTGEIYFDPADG